MIEEIKKSASEITEMVDRVIKNNTDKSFINRTEFEFICKHDTYKTTEFKEILDNHFNGKNVTYTFEEIRPHVAYFDIKLHDWISK